MKSNVVLSLLIAAAFPAFGQSADSLPLTLKEVAQQAVLNSPEVTSKWHAYRAAQEEVGVGVAGFAPRVDLTVSSGQENLQQLSGENSYHRNAYLINFNQMLFDGFATHSEVKRLGKAKLVRYYELLDASENTALEAGRAYIDVLRYRQLVELAQDNYVQHKATYEQLQRRTQSGVGRRVDLEQAGSRLALAEINLTTELANLHDVTARYQRLVGAQPPASVEPPAVTGSGLPESANAALAALHQKNPALLAAIENTEAAQFEVDVRRAAYSPKFDFRARADHSTNYLGTPGTRDHHVAEVVMTVNLFNGGADLAREKQTIEKKNVALDLREKACRDTRQTLMIAYNDVQRLKQQTGYLTQQVNLLARTRDAYRDQFNIGQRTLLDLLDTENEYLSARRASVNANADLSLAYLRSYAGMGVLLEELGLKKLETDAPAIGEVASVDSQELCPADPVAIPQPDRDALDARAMALVSGNKLVSPSAAPVAAGAAGEDVARQVRAWAGAWAAKNYTAYASHYAPSFVPEGGMAREDWAQLRRNRLATPGAISVDVQDMKVRLEGSDRAVVEFRQSYQSSTYRDTTLKTLEMIKSGGKWMINRESSVPCSGAVCRK